MKFTCCLHDIYNVNCNLHMKRSDFGRKKTDKFYGKSKDKLGVVAPGEPGFIPQGGRGGRVGTEI